MFILGEQRPDLLRHETLPDILADTARRLPQQIAIVDGARTIDYAAFHAAAQDIALRLTGAQVAQRVVGLWMQRGAELLIAQAGITCAGAAWLPIDADAPPDRVVAILRDTNAVLLLADAEHAARLPSSPIPILDPTALPPATTGTHPVPPAPDDTAYVIATSGTTGRPKSIAISHRAICHFLRSENAVLGVTATDRVHQGFSVSFDMSFEEIWITWLAGATLCCADKTVASDPETLASHLRQQRITVLHAVPSLAALISDIPPDLRLVNLGGEACPQAVADRWAHGRRQVFNTYGPTETTVTATYARLTAGEPVTIGRPLPNYGLAVVDEHLHPVGPGIAGELCAFGPGLAIGYLGREELTRARFPISPFPDHPTIPRCYRTGDQVLVDDAGALRFIGRIDDQVKVRGFRVELGEVESSLTAITGIRAAAVVVRDDRLVAFVVMDDEHDETRLRQELGTNLPAYMVPARILRRESLPRLPSGKVDRRALAAEPLPAQPHGAGDVPATPAETALAAALTELMPGQPFCRAADFFAELGGHSLLAARLVSRLRELGFPKAAVRDVYGQPRLGELAQALTAGNTKTAERAPASTRPARWRRLMGGTIQALLLPLPMTLHLAAWLAPFFTYHWLTGDEEDGILIAVAWSVVVFLLAQVAQFLLAFLAKWLVLGRLPAGRHPLWGQIHLRWWFAETMISAAPVWLLNGTPYYRIWLRLLGARIGREVFIGNMAVRSSDQLTIGDGAAIGSSVSIANVRISEGHLIAAPVIIGARTLVDSYAVITGGSTVGRDATLGPLSALAEHAQVPDGAHWQGAPARPSAEPAPSAPHAPFRPGPCTRLWEWIFFPIAGAGVSVLFFVPIFPAFMLIDWIDERWLDTWDESVHTALAALSYLVLGIPTGALLVAATLIAAALLRRLVLPHLAPGSWSIHSFLYYRKWITTHIQDASLHLLHGLFATVYAPWWFRLLGARVGRNTEISSALGLTPELLELGDDCFVADAALLGDELVRDGWMTVRGTRVGSRTFIGNGACVPDGAQLPADVLIGVQTLTPPNRLLASGQTWMGSPALRLPARETSTGFPDHLTFRPSPARRLARGSIELVRIVLPLACVMAFGYLAVRTVMPLFVDDDWLAGCLALAGAGLLFGHACLFAVLAAKWLLIGRYRPRAAPMWTLFVWVSEALTAVYESLAVPHLLGFLQGTPLLPFYLRLFGAHIGRDVHLDTTDFTEFDCVTIGDGTVLDAASGPQTHLFEDRIMKIGTVAIGADVEVGACSTILYDTVVGDRVRLSPLTLVAKGERLPDGTDWSGSPAAPR